jgi:hypothetical protein
LILNKVCFSQDQSRSSPSIFTYLERLPSNYKPKEQRSESHHWQILARAPFSIASDSSSLASGLSASPSANIAGFEMVFRETKAHSRVLFANSGRQHEFRSSLMTSSNPNALIAASTSEEQCALIPSLIITAIYQSTPQKFGF